MKNYTSKLLTITLAIGFGLLGCSTQPDTVATTNKNQPASAAGTTNKNQPANVAIAEKTPDEEKNLTELSEGGIETYPPPGRKIADETKSADSKSSAKINIGNFEKIENGMTYDEVAKLLGDRGMQTSTMKVNGRETEMFMWTEGDGFQKYINITFENKKVVEKKQKGL